jgi:hypothetical protein
MFEIIGIPKEILRKAKMVQVIKFNPTPKTIYIDMVYIDKGRHEGTVSWDRSINPMVNLIDALWCECYICSSIRINTKEFCRLKTRAAQELIKRGFWPKEVERYLYGDGMSG